MYNGLAMTQSSMTAFFEEISNSIINLTKRLEIVEQKLNLGGPQVSTNNAANSQPPSSRGSKPPSQPKTKSKDVKEDDDDVDLFGSDSNVRIFPFELFFLFFLNGN